MTFQLSIVGFLLPWAHAQMPTIRDGEKLANKCYLSETAQKDRRAQFDLRIILYAASAQIKSMINARRIETHLMASTDQLGLVDDLKTVRPLLEELKPLIGSAFFQSWHRDPNFSEFSRSLEFRQTLSGPAFEPETSHGPQFAKLMENPEARQHFKKLRELLAEKSMETALKSIADRGLTIFTPAGFRSALEIAELFSTVNINFKNPVLQVNLPFPERLNGPFADKIKDIVTRNLLREYLFEAKISQGEVDHLRATKALPKEVWERADQLHTLVQKRNPGINLADAINQDVLPRQNAMDQYLVPTYFEQDLPVSVEFEGAVRTVPPAQALAIDALARTLMGEAMMCHSTTDQFVAIARIVLARKEKLVSTLSSNARLEEINMSLREQNAKLFSSDRSMSQLRRLRTGTLTTAFYGRLHHKDVFRGPAGESIKANQLDPIAQILSAPKQFNAWAERAKEVPRTLESLREKKSKWPPGIPHGIRFSYYKPVKWNSMEDLWLTLCPPDPEDRRRKIWQNALQIAKQVVLDPEKFKNRYKWEPTSEILFYSHGPDVVGMDLVSDARLNDCSLSEKACRPMRLAAGPSQCQKIRFFKPPSEIE